MLVKDIPSAPFDASVPSQALSNSQLSRAPPPSSLIVHVHTPKWGQKQELVVRVERPRDSRALRRIHATIEAIMEYGPDFEALLMEREKYNEDYAFLFDSNVLSPHTFSLVMTTDTKKATTSTILSLEIIFFTKW